MIQVVTDYWPPHKMNRALMQAMYDIGKLANSLYHILREYARDSTYYLKYSFLMLALKNYSFSLFRIKCNNSRCKFCPPSLSSCGSSTSIIQADFDRLATLSREGWDHNSHYHNFLLKHIPPHCSNALELGCGTGTFARLLAIRAEQVLALDLSPQMIRIARERSLQFSNIDFQVANALLWEFPPEQFDCIISIATLHHLPMEEMLIKMKRALKVNGVLIILDLYQQSLFDAFTLLASLPIDLVLKYLKTGRFKEPQEVREAWAEHGRHDAYLTLSQLRHLCQGLLPGAKIRKHLLWRYSLIWRKRAIL